MAASGTAVGPVAVLLAGAWMGYLAITGRASLLTALFNPQPATGSAAGQADLSNASFGSYAATPKTATGSGGAYGVSGSATGASAGGW